MNNPLATMCELKHSCVMCLRRMYVRGAKLSVIGAVIVIHT